MSDLAPNYNFKENEKKWRQIWREKGTYKWDATLPREENFSIDTPPPTVSGQLHMGHIFSYTQADFVARYQRMKGKNVFYPIGFDDNGLPTERLVEKKRDIRAVTMSREEFIAVCNEIVPEEEDKFRQLFSDIALSVDWDFEYRTISETSRKISQMSFLDLVQKEQAYRSEQPMLWDPVDQTALSQADVEDKEKPSKMYDILFATELGEKLTIATTRPELLAACVAVFYHPEDGRYQHLKGQFAITPLFNVKVPLLPDAAVDREKGTGLVMCCTFGDITDINWWKMHKLPLRLILSKDGKIKHINLADISVNLESANYHLSQIVDLKVNAARSKVIELLQSYDLVLKEVDIIHMVKCAERSGAPLEILSTAQWFIRSLPHKQALIEKAQQVNWHPSHMKIRLEQWIEGLTWDWCISRQRFFGVPLPVWYSKRQGEEGKILFAEQDQLPVNPFTDLPKGYSREEVEPDPDVMDTWATSAVSPQLSSMAITKKYAIDYDMHKKLFPFDLRPQAHEIIRTWAFSTMLKSYLHEGIIPWKNIMISGWCLSHDKTKMSKSKGNIIDPVGLIEQYGADTIRYWASTSRLGADTAYSEDIVKNGRRLQNKLWNAAKFVLQHFSHLSSAFPQTVAAALEAKHIFHPTDLWITSKLNLIICDATKHFEEFEYAQSREVIEKFFWKDFCDDYLEIAKVRIYSTDAACQDQRQSGLLTLYFAFRTILKLFAPFMPHITDELYSNLYESSASLHERGMWPNKEEFPLSREALFLGHQMQEFVGMVRKAKAEKQLSVKAEVACIEYHARDFHTFNQLAVQELANSCNAAEIKSVEVHSQSGERVAEGDKIINLIYSLVT